jgi:hypothetical protein
MRKLVLSVLPVLPDLDAIVNVRTATTCRFNGRTFTKHGSTKAYARDIVPLSQWRKAGKSVLDVMGDLERKGFIVRNQGTVACALSQALGSRWSNVQAVSQPRPFGRPRKLYFATE